ncbi:hypothetical protein ZOSMA_2847G00010, partial [Zostera marina]
MDEITSILFLVILGSLTILFFKMKPADKNTGKNLPPNLGQNFVHKLLWLKVSLLTAGYAIKGFGTKLGPIVTAYFGPFPAIFVLDRNLIHEAFVKKGKILTLLRRNLTSQILNSSGTKSFSVHRKKIIGLLLRDLRGKARNGGSDVGIIGLFRSSLFMLVSLMCFGKQDDDLVDDIEMNHRGLVDIFFKLNVFDFSPVLAKILYFKRWRSFTSMRKRQEELYIPIIQKIRRRRDEQGIKENSYIDTVLALDIPVEDGTIRKPTDDEAVSLAHEFFTTGMETTITTIEWAMANIIKHPHIQKRLLDEINSVVPKEMATEDIEEDSLLNMPYLKAVIYETLRRHPPVETLLPHSNPQGDETIGPYHIPKGSMINAILDVGMDENVWPDPNEFNPERFLMKKGQVVEFDENVADITGNKREVKLIPFGLGRRLCPAIAMAMLHIRYYLACLVREFEWKTAEGNDEVDLTREYIFSIVMKNQLNARVRLGNHT